MTMSWNDSLGIYPTTKSKNMTFHGTSSMIVIEVVVVVVVVVVHDEVATAGWSSNKRKRA